MRQMFYNRIPHKKRNSMMMRLISSKHSKVLLQMSNPITSDNLIRFPRPSRCSTQILRRINLKLKDWSIKSRKINCKHLSISTKFTLITCWMSWIISKVIKISSSRKRVTYRRKSWSNLIILSQCKRSAINQTSSHLTFLRILKMQKTRLKY